MFYFAIGIPATFKNVGGSSPKRGGFHSLRTFKAVSGPLSTDKDSSSAGSGISGISGQFPKKEE